MPVPGAAATAMKALDVLELLAGDARGQGLNEIARHLRCSRSSTVRVLAALKEKGLLVHDQENRRYRLTLRLLELGTRLLNELELPDVAKPHLLELSTRSGETAHLGVLEGWHVVFIGKSEPPNPIRLHARIGFRAASHCTGLGKVMLAGLPASELDRYLATYSFTRFTDDTITTPAAFAEHLRLVRERGYAIDAEEHRAGIGCVAAPVRDHTGRVVAGMSVSGPAFRVLQEHLDALIEDVRAGALALSRDLGFRPQPGDGRA